MDLIAAVVAMSLAAAFIGIVVAERLLPRMRRAKLLPADESEPRSRWRPRIFVLAAALLGAVPLWAFASGHGRLGVAFLIAVFVLPEFVIVPLQIRRSRRRAAETHARRDRES